jgi:hypothetical protein
MEPRVPQRARDQRRAMRSRVAAVLLRSWITAGRQGGADHRDARQVQEDDVESSALGRDGGERVVVQALRKRHADHRERRDRRSERECCSRAVAGDSRGRGHGGAGSSPQR